MDGQKNSMSAWITLAIENGGMLTITRNNCGDYIAALVWARLPDEPPIEGDGKTLEEALAQLEANIIEDAAKEMQRNGAA